MDAQQIVNAIRNPSIAMSKEQIDDAWEALRIRHRTIQAMATTQFAKGDLVEFKSRGGKTLRGVVTKINQKTINVRVTQDVKRVVGGVEAMTVQTVNWRVAASLLRKVEPN